MTGPLTSSTTPLWELMHEAALDTPINPISCEQDIKDQESSRISTLRDWLLPEEQYPDPLQACSRWEWNKLVIEWDHRQHLRSLLTVEINHLRQTNESNR